MIELCCEYLYVWWIWLYVLTMPRTCFRVNPHSINTSLTFRHLWHPHRVWIHSEARTWHDQNTVKYTIQIVLTSHSIIWPVWLNGWVFVFELNGCGSESICTSLISKSFLTIANSGVEIRILSILGENYKLSKKWLHKNGNGAWRSFELTLLHQGFDFWEEGDYRNLLGGSTLAWEKLLAE